MTPLAFYPLRFAGYAVLGLALGVGWKLGSRLVDTAMGDRELKLPSLSDLKQRYEASQPLWKRRFTRITEA